MFKKICLIIFSLASVFADNSFRFVLKSNRQVSDPIYILKNELFNVQFVTTTKKPYNFVLTNSKSKAVYTRTEKIDPYYLYGDNSGVPKYGSLGTVDDYTITIKETKDNVKFQVVNQLPTTTTPTTTTISNTTSTTPTSTTTISNTTSTTSTTPTSTTPSGKIDISHCAKGFPVALNTIKDHIALHYDMSYDPDDYLSAVADRSALEPTYGTQFLRDQTTRVIGTCGGSCSGYNTPADKLMQYTYGDVGGYKVTIGANDPKKYTEAMNYELDFFKETIKRGGRVFVKEGGESDFTKRIIEQLEIWLPNSGKCVYIVQHSAVNEKNNGAGVLAYVKSKANYIKISDGNPPYQKSNWSLNGKTFDFYGLQSRWECAWKLAFDDFKVKKSYCNSKAEPIQKCVDFSDTHELLYIMGIDSSTSTGNLGVNGFVTKYLVANSDKIKCDSVPIITYFLRNVKKY